MVESYFCRVVKKNRPVITTQKIISQTRMYHPPTETHIMWDSGALLAAYENQAGKLGSEEKSSGTQRRKGFQKTTETGEDVFMYTENVNTPIEAINSSVKNPLIKLLPTEYEQVKTVRSPFGKNNLRIVKTKFGADWGDPFTFYVQENVDTHLIRTLATFPKKCICLTSFLLWKFMRQFQEKCALHTCIEFAWHTQRTSQGMGAIGRTQRSN